MVTRSVIRISAEEKAALDAKASKHHENDRLLEDERKSLDDANDGDIDRGCAGNLDCDTSLPLPPTLPPLSPLDLEVVQGRSMEITQQDNDTNKKRRRDAQNGKNKKKYKPLDLSDVPEQPPIRSESEGGSSKFKGVTFSKAMKKWRARIWIDGKERSIGCYDNEEEAAIDYARAVFKYKEGNTEDGSGQKKKISIDLTDVPAQPPIKSERKSSNSQYKGISFNKAMKKWQASIDIDGKQRTIGSYDDEEEAAIDYARAVFKYKAGNTEDGNGQKKKISIDLTDVPAQPPIKSERKGSSSQYKGVTFNKVRKKWVTTLYIGDEGYFIGYYENEEEAAVDYARAVFKYKGANNEDGSGQNKLNDLTGIPLQMPIKSERKGSSSQYKGVYFHAEKKKWIAMIQVDGKKYGIGSYDNEEEAAIDYARAVFKYKKGMLKEVVYRRS